MEGAGPETPHVVENAASDLVDVSHRAGERAVGNIALRAIGESVGKLASLALFAAMARHLGQSGLGVFTFGLAFVQVTTIPVDFGFDRYLLRQIAADRSRIDTLVARVARAKLAFAMPAIATTVLLVGVLGYDARTRHTVYVLAIGFVFDALARVIFSVFMAVEQSGLLALTVVVQRTLVAAAGLIALHEGLGVVSVATCYTAGSLVSILIAASLLKRQIGWPRAGPRGGGYGKLVVASLPFAVQDVFGVLLFKLDAVILSLMSTTAAVGRYGAAYRLFESTFLIHISLAGAFAAMYTYLGPQTSPTVGSVFQRSLSFCLIALTPVGIVLAVLPSPITRLIYGPGFGAAAEPLRLLAPAVVLIGLVTLCTTLIVSRTNARRILRVTAAMVLLNIALNVALIPTLTDRGAATAMLVTEAAFLLTVLPPAVRLAGGVDWWAMSASPLLAGAAMAGAMLPLQPALATSLAVGLSVYAVVLLVLQRIISPADHAFLVAFLARRFVRRAGQDRSTVG